MQFKEFRWAGRAIIHRHVVKLVARWPIVCRWFLATIETRFSGLFDKLEIIDELFKATECLVELVEIMEIQCSQSKLSEETINKLGGHWNALGTSLDRHYPTTNPFWKAHSGIAHIAQAAR